MATKNVTPQTNPPYYPYNQSEATPPLGPRKTIFVLATVIGCIAILWPKIFYPMMFGASEVPIKNNYLNKDLGSKPGGCCGMVLDHEKYANVTQPAGQSGYRKQLNLMTGEISLRQERPPHLRGDHIHPAMIERGRAIPNTQSVPIVSDRPQRASDQITIIDGRPGPIPGMRPPGMGAGAMHQANQKGSSMGLLMPMYTFGIVAFFVYTIMKLVMRKTDDLTPYPPPKNEGNFKQEVFRRDNSKIPNLEWKHHDTSSHANGILNSLLSHLNGSNHQTAATTTSLTATPNYGRPSFYDDATTTAKLEFQLRETEQLLEISLLKKKLRETERAMEQIIADIHGKAAKCNSDENNASNTNDATMDVTTTQDATDNTKDEHDSEKSNGHVKLTDSKKNANGNDEANEYVKIENATRCRDSSAERKLQSSTESEPESEPQSIFLEGALPHESQILVSDSQTTPEGVYNEEVNGNSDEPAVILSSKMTLSLINLDPVSNENGGNASNGTSDHESEEVEYEDEEDEEVVEEEEEEEVDEEEADGSDDNGEIENIHGVAK
ncbi:uncharacterized protein LOC129573666 isoform X2 [Sitodiplosis mosellana]|uniref:uncharacterized protein LOC129573666 isoform X2 n=1 Tax=Sitodiplosis mosellana TaxID=263140 RepID=UPI0024445900|nr:uncharacterized protein LOC129573666 isoform X2 [Sitodiplosis mosellana]